MYLVLAEEYHPHTKRERSPRRSSKQHPHTEWNRLCTKHREAGLHRNTRTKEIADYMKQILPTAKNPQTNTPDIELPTLKAKSRGGTRTDFTSAFVTDIRPSKDIIYETPKRDPVREDDDDDDDDWFLEEDERGLIEKM